MKSIFFIFIIFITAILLMSLIWRFFSSKFSLPCPVWLSWLIEVENPFTRISRAQTIIEHLHIEPGMKVLDAGCGPGRVTIPLAVKIGQAGEVWAMDLQSGMLQRIKKKSSQECLKNIKFLHAAIGEGKLKHDYFDRIILVTVLGEIPDQKSAIKELFNALNAGGILSITEIIFDPHFIKQSVVRDLAHLVGLHEKELFGNRFAYTINFEKR